MYASKDLELWVEDHISTLFTRYLTAWHLVANPARYQICLGPDCPPPHGACPFHSLLIFFETPTLPFIVTFQLLQDS